MWPPKASAAFVDAAAQRALAFQRYTFFRLLRVNDALATTGEDDAGEKVDPAAIDAVKRATEEAAEDLMSKHAKNLPDCKRAPAHLQMAALALGAQRSLEEAEASQGTALIGSKLKMRSIVANAVGVFAPPDGSSEPVAVPAMWVPNRIAMTITGAMWLESRRGPMLERMMANFEADLGHAFILEQIEPTPSRRLRRCFYHNFFEAEGEPMMQPVFSAIHATTWAGVPGFRFERAEDGQCSFVFE